MEARLPSDYSPAHGFASTRWTTIRACGGNDPAATIARENLCRDYWYPVYAYIKRLGPHGHEAEDLTQDFFAYILGRTWFLRADQTKGRFRTFLLASVDNFLRDCLDRKRAIKRGGEYQHVPLDMGNAEFRSSLGAAVTASPVEVYDVEWVSAVVASTLGRLKEEYDATGKSAQYQHLECYLMTDGDAERYGATANELDTTVANVKVSVHRLRKRYGAILRDQVATTVAAPEDVDDEVRYMRSILAAAR